MGKCSKGKAVLLGVKQKGRFRREGVKQREKCGLHSIARAESNPSPRILWPQAHSAWVGPAGRFRIRHL